MRTDTLLYMLYVLYAMLPLLLRLRFWRWSWALDGQVGFAFPCLLLREVALVSAVLKPVVYMVWPPETPEWGELVREGEDGVRRPRKSGGRRGKGGVGGWILGVAGEMVLLSLVVWG